MSIITCMRFWQLCFLTQFKFISCCLKSYIAHQSNNFLEEKTAKL